MKRLHLLKRVVLLTVMGNTLFAAQYNGYHAPYQYQPAPGAVVPVPYPAPYPAAPFIPPYINGASYNPEVPYPLYSVPTQYYLP